MVMPAPNTALPMSSRSRLDPRAIIWPLMQPENAPRIMFDTRGSSTTGICAVSTLRASSRRTARVPASVPTAAADSRSAAKRALVVA